MLQMLEGKKVETAKPQQFHASSAYLFQDNCVNLSSDSNIAGDWVNVQQGGFAGGPSGSQLDKIEKGVCSPMFILQRVLKPRSVHTTGGAGAAWDGKLYRIIS
mmetsp:Transcript_81953/g.220079  ORF Transcript_81953/g.220079 Transcript_81953/m.220079 type:complete len:103 (-) Transcript_81953:42-350(-)